jgi:hypothetical protein
MLLGYVILSMAQRKKWDPERTKVAIEAKGTRKRAATKQRGVACRILVEKHKGKDNLEYTCVYGRILLRCTGEWAWTRLIWFRIGITGCHLQKL